jgi:hypothetical protein
MCDRCATTKQGQWPLRRWPDEQPQADDFGPPLDLEPNDQGAAPVGGFFGIGAR